MKNKESEILNITKDSIINIYINDEWIQFQPCQSNDDSWDLIDRNNSNNLYGLSCINIGELKSLLLADFYIGVYKDICIE